MFKSLAFGLGVLALMTTSIIAQEGNEKKEKQNTMKVNVGDEAPNWKLGGTDGKTYQLSDFKGKKGVVVAWYPAALTGG